MRLIDADSLKNKIQQHRDLFVDAWDGFQEMSLADKSRVDEIDNCIAEIVNAPTIEANPVVHGYWREYNRSALVSWKNGEPVWVDRAVYYCDGCSFGTIIKHNYCPRCGQKMDGGVSDG